MTPSTDAVEPPWPPVISLPEGEPAAGPWRVAPFAELLELLGLSATTSGGPRPRIVAVDGRGGGGKTTLARRLADAVPASALVHTDDVAWHHDFFDWSQLLAGGVLQPLHRGEPVSYRPPGWITHDRPGSIEVPAGSALVVVEGVGAARRDLGHLFDAIVWMQSDFTEAERRGIARDVEQGVNGDLAQATVWWHRWMDRELPFQREQATWARATVVANGTPPVPIGPDEVLLAPAPR